MLDKVGAAAKVSVRTSLYLFLGNTFSTIVLAVATILVANLLDPDSYGLYTLALIAPTFILELSSFGISTALTRFVPNLRSKGSVDEAFDLIKIGIIFKATVSVLSAIMLFILSDLIAVNILNRPSLSPLIRMLPLFIIGQAVFETINYAFIGLDRAEYSGLIMGAHAVTRAIVSISLILLGLGVTGPILATVVSPLLAGGLGVLFLLRGQNSKSQLHSQKKRISYVKGLKRLILFGVPLYLRKILLSFVRNYQVFILALFASNVEIGNYRAALTFSSFMLILIYPIENSLLSTFSKFNIDEDRSSLERMFKLSMKYVSFLVVPVTVFFTIFSNEVISVLYGNKYALAPEYLSLFMLTFLLILFGKFTIPTFFNSQGGTQNSFKMILIKCLIITPLVPVLTSVVGVSGLLLSVIIGEIAMIAYVVNILYRSYSILIDWTSSVRIILAALIPALVTYLIQQVTPLSNPILSLIINGLIFFTIYVLSAPLTGAINITDIKNLDFMTRDTPIHRIIKLAIALERRLIVLYQRVF